MTKKDFLNQLEKGLSNLPKKEIEERLRFYSEIIDDRMEEGLSEEEAVEAVGSVPEIVAISIEETPLLKIAKEKIKPKRRLQSWEILLLVLGSPIWLSLLVAVFAVVFALYVSIWSLIVSLWAVFGSLAAASFGCIFSGAVLIYKTDILTGVALIGAGIFCLGLSIFIFYCLKALTEGIVMLTKHILLSLKRCFIKKEEA